MAQKNGPCENIVHFEGKDVRIDRFQEIARCRYAVSVDQILRMSGCDENRQIRILSDQLFSPLDPVLFSNLHV